MLIIYGFQHEGDKKIEKQKKIFRVFFFFLHEWILMWKVGFGLCKKQNIIGKNEVIKKPKEIYTKYNKK